MNRHLESAWWTLRIAFGATAFLAGLDKFFNLLANWEAYVSPLMTSIIPLSAGTLMRVAGVIEMIAGIAVLAGLTRLGGYVIAAWLTLIAISLLTTGRYFDVAVARSGDGRGRVDARADQRDAAFAGAGFGVRSR